MLNHIETDVQARAGNYARLESLDGLDAVFSKWEKDCDERKQEEKVVRKAEIELLLAENAIFPHQIPRVVIPVNEEFEPSVKNELTKIIVNGGIPGIRTAIQPGWETRMECIGTSPTQYGHIQTLEDIDKAVESLMHVLHENSGIRNVILMDNPRFLFGEQEQKSGLPLVGRIAWFADNFTDHTTEFRIEGLTETSGMRTLDAALDGLNENKDEKSIVPESDMIISGVLTTGYACVRKIGDIFNFEFDWSKNLEMLKYYSNISNHTFPLEVQIRASQHFFENLIRKWSSDPYIALTQRMETMRRVGLDIIELQARLPSLHSQWNYSFYDFRGPKDDTFRTGFRLNDPNRDDTNSSIPSKSPEKSSL